MKAIRIDAAGIVEPIELAEDPAVRRCQLRNDVDGNLEAVRLDGFSLVFSRESAARERPVPNRVATLLAAAWASSAGSGGPYFGAVVLTGDERDLPASVGGYLGLIAGRASSRDRGPVDA